MILLFLLLFFSKSTKVKVQVTGFIPFFLRLMNTSNGRPDVHLIYADFPHNFFSKLDNYGMKYRCIFEDKAPPFSIIEGNQSAKYDFLIPPNFSIKNLLVNLLNKRNFSSIISNNNHIEAKYKVVPGDDFSDKKNSPGDLGFDFLDDLSLKYLVFSREYYDQFCKRRIQDMISPALFSLGLAFAVFILLYIFFNSLTYLIKLPNKIDNLWLVPPNSTIDFFDKYDLTPLQKHFLHRTYSISNQMQTVNSGVIKMTRKIQSASFERVTAIPFKNGYYFVIKFEEDTYIDTKSSIVLEFESNDPSIISIKGRPELEFVSFRDVIPYNIKFTLAHNASCTMQFPLAVVSAFQPYGQFLSNFHLIMGKIYHILFKNLFLRSNFVEAISMFCEQVKANHAYCFTTDGSLIFEYGNPTIKNSDLPFINQQVQKDQFQKFSDLFPKQTPFSNTRFNDKNNNQSDDNGQICYTSIINLVSLTLKYVICFNKFPTNQILKSLGSPIMTICCMFVYQMSFYKEQCLRFDHFIDLITSSKEFAFWELPSDISTIYLLKSSIPGLDLTKPENITQESLFKHKEDRDLMLSECYKVIDTKGTLKQFVFETTNPECQWISMSALADFDPVLGKTVLTIIFEEISKIKKQEKDLIETIYELDIAMKALGFHKFIVDNENGDIILENSSLPVSLGYDENIRNLKDIIFPPDLSKLELLSHPQKVVFKLISFQNKQIFYNTLETADADNLINGDNNNEINDMQEESNDYDPSKFGVWYSAVSNGNSGFIFCVNDIIEVRTHSNKGNKIQSSNLIVWSVDFMKENVHQLFELPTIWDILSVDKHCEFSKFVNFVHQDDKELFFTTYSRLMKGVQQYWTGEVKLLKIGGIYEWYRLCFARANRDLLYCVALNVNAKKMEDKKMSESFEQRNELFTNSQMMLWSFEDTRTPLLDEDDEQKLNFEPGIKQVLTMNWDFVQKHISSKCKKEFTQKMTKAIRNDQYFEMTVELLFCSKKLEKTPAHTLNSSYSEEKTHIVEENMKHVYAVFQGKFVPQLSKVIGFCIEVNDLIDKHEKELEEIRTIALKKCEKDNKINDINYNIHTLLCNIFGIIDIVTTKATLMQQIAILSTAGEVCSIIHKLFLNPITHNMYLNRKPSEFNLLDVLNEIIGPFYSYSLLNNKDFKVIVEGSYFPQNVEENLHSFGILITFLMTKVIQYQKIKVIIGWHRNYLEVDCYTDTETTNQNESADSTFASIMKEFGGVSVNIKNDLKDGDYNEFYTRRFSLVPRRLSPILCDGTRVSTSNPSVRTPLIQNDDSKTNSFLSNSNVKESWFSFSHQNGCYSLSIPIKTKSKENSISDSPPISKSNSIDSINKIIKVLVAVEERWLRLEIIKALKILNYLDWSVYDTSRKNCEIPKGITYIIIGSEDIYKQILIELDKILFEKPKLIMISNKSPISTNLRMNKVRKSLFKNLNQMQSFESNNQDIITLYPPIVINQIRKFFDNIYFNKVTASINNFKSPIHIEIIKRNVLIVEDDKINQYVIEKMLDAFGCTHSIAENGEQALQILDSMTFDIVFLDYEIPILDGAATTRIIRKSPKRYASIPIIGISALGSHKEDCLNAGMDTFYLKPIRLHQVKDALTQFN